MQKIVFPTPINAVFMLIFTSVSTVYAPTPDVTAQLTEIQTTLLNLNSKVDQVEQFAKAAYAKTTEISDSMRKRQEMENALLKSTTGTASPEELVQKLQQAKASANTQQAANNSPEDNPSDTMSDPDNFYLNNASQR